MRAEALGFQQPRLDRGDDFLGDFILQREDVSEVTVKVIGPKVIAGRGVINWAVMRARLPPLRTLPSST